MIIKEAEKNFSKEEQRLHSILGNEDESMLMGYILKRNFYKEPTKEEIDAINDIYADGTTYFNCEIQGKVNKLRLLTQKDYADIKAFVDDEFSKGTPPKRNILNEEDRKQAKQDLTLTATVAAAAVSMSDSIIEIDAAPYLQTCNNNVLASKVYFLENLPSIVIRTLYDRYNEFENRIYDIFQYESVKKK
jgi:hypothetical protein